MSDVVSGVDYSQYKNWQMVKTPSGGTYYAVPGTAFVYDPYMSQVKGQPVLWKNPQPELDEKQKAEDYQQKQLDMQEQAASPLGQALPVVGGVAGTVGGAYLIDTLASSPSAVSALPNGAVLMSDGTIKAAGGAVSSAAPTAAAAPVAAPTTAAQAFTGGASSAGASTAIPATAAPTPATTLPTGLVNVAGPLALAGISAYTGSKTYDAFRAGQKEDNAWGGLKAGFKEAGPLNLVPVLGQAAWLGGMLGGLFHHKSTKEIQRNREDSVAAENPAYAAFVNQARATQQEHPEIKNGYNPAQDKDFVGVDPQTGLWTNNKFATGGSAGGKKYDVKNLVADDLRGTPDFVKRYPDWFSKSDEEQRSIAQQALDAGAVESKKGGIYVNFDKLDANKTGKEVAARMDAGAAK